MGEYMGTHPIFESDFDCLTEWSRIFHIFRIIFSHIREQMISRKISLSRKKRKIPVRVNSSYGKRPALEIHNRDHVRVIQTREFYSKNGIGLGRVFDLQKVILQQYRCW